MKILQLEAEELRVIEMIVGCKAKNRVDEYNLFRHFFSFSMQIACRYTVSDQEAKIVVNECFFKVFTNIKKFDTNKDFKPWLKTIIVNTSIDNIRAKKRDKLFQYEEVKDIRIEEKSNNEDIFMEGEGLLLVLQALPPKYKVVFNLYVFEDYSHKEIADKLNISLSTSKTNYMRAKAIVKSQLLGRDIIDEKIN